MYRLFIAEDKKAIDHAFTKEQIGESAVISNQEFLQNTEKYRDVEAIFSTWGMLRLSEDQIREYLPRLKYIFYAAGTVIPFAIPYLKVGVRVFSAWCANAIPVAEYTVAQIILANKGFFHMHTQYSQYGFKQARENADLFPGNYGTNVGLIGLGMISRHIIELLKPYKLNIYVASKHLTAKKANELGVHKAELLDIFKDCQTISNHLANKVELKGVLNYSLFSRMKDNATFINTGRGAQVNEKDLVKAMEECPNRVALLDVTDPEPIETTSILWNHPNIIITPHRAGSSTKEIFRMGEYMMDEYEKVVKNEPVQYEVTLDMLKTMA